MNKDFKIRQNNKSNTKSPISSSKKNTTNTENRGSLSNLNDNTIDLVNIDQQQNLTNLKSSEEVLNKIKSLTNIAKLRVANSKNSIEQLPQSNTDEAFITNIRSKYVKQEEIIQIDPLSEAPIKIKEPVIRAPTIEESLQKLQQPEVK